MVDVAPTLPVNPVIIKAQEAIAVKLGLPASAVSIIVGDDDRSYSGAAPIGENTNITLKVQAPGVLFNEDVEEATTAKLGGIAAMKKWQWESQYKLVTKLNTDLATATSDVEGFNKKLLESPIFKLDKEKKERVAGVQSYALSDVNVGDFGVSVTLSRPSEKDVNHAPELEKVAAALNDPAQNTDIKEVLTARVIKNLEIKLKGEGKLQAEIDTELEKAKADMAKMVIKASMDTRWANGVRVTFRSPDQAKEAEGKQNPDYAQSDNGVKLRADNPLSHLDDKVTEKKPHPELQKSLARALFYDKNKQIRPDMVNFLGEMDMKAALAKEFFRLQKDRPEKAEAFANVLASQLFKNHGLNQNQPDAGPPEATTRVPPGQSDLMIVTLPIKRKELEATLTSFAAPEVAPAGFAAALGQTGAITPSSLLTKGPTSLLDQAKSSGSMALGA